MDTLNKDFLKHITNEGMRFAGIEDCKAGIKPTEQHPAYQRGYKAQQEFQNNAGKLQSLI